MGVTINKKSTTTEPPPKNGQQPKPPGGLNMLTPQNELEADSNKRQLRGKRQICNNLFLYESDVMQGGGFAMLFSLVEQSKVAKVWQPGHV